MKPVAILLILAGSLLLAGCQSGSSSAPKSAASKATSATQLECTCGTHEAKLHGCSAPACMSGQGNPDNPKCFCAPLKPVQAPVKGN
jgi:hypothetical protein